MTDTANAVRTAAVSTGLSALAGLLGGPLTAAAAGFVSGLPVQLIAATSLAAMIWLDPMTGIWLAIAAAAAIGGFILGAVRTPHPALYSRTSGQDSTARIAHLEDQLARASQREAALLAALALTRIPPAAPAAPVIRGQVTT